MCVCVCVEGWGLGGNDEPPPPLPRTHTHYPPPVCMHERLFSGTAKHAQNNTNLDTELTNLTAFTPELTEVQALTHTIALYFSWIINHLIYFKQIELEKHDS